MAGRSSRYLPWSTAHSKGELRPLESESARTLLLGTLQYHARGEEYQTRSLP